ncbi:hypothetical protein MAP00_002807 [Monascus purpureus]|nr:hypothetical protein MAP00_002807 [Monascus purpureus]
MGRMAGPGGGPPRKSHTKSRNGCKTCKRRHIRCDESFPQCRNCTKHNCRCDYMDVAAAQEESMKTRRVPDLLMTPEIEIEINNWHATGVSPFPELVHCPRSSWYGLSRSDLRLVHHIIGLSFDLYRRGFSNCTPWAQRLPNFLTFALSNDFVLHSILALSAFHLSWTTGNQDTKHLAYHHRGIAIKGLQGAIGSFSNKNCEAILAASILLSWGATEWQLWASLQQGLSTVLNAMHPSWKQESDIARFLETQQVLRSINSAISNGYRRFPEGDLAHLDQTITGLENVQSRVSHNHEYYTRIEELLEFLRQLRKDLPMQSPEQIFGRIQPLIQWLFWLPPAILRGGDTDISGLAILAQFFGVGVELDSLFSDMGIAYLGALSVGPIEDIFRIVAVRNSMDPFNAEFQLALSLLDLPRHILARYKDRLHWSPRPTIDHSHTSPPPPYRSSPHGFSLAASSSSPTSPQYSAYTSPVHSPPAVPMTTSPFEMAPNYVTVPASHAHYPHMPQVLSDIREPRTVLSHFSNPSASHLPAFTSTYADGMWSRTTQRTDGAPLGLNLELYNGSHPFNAGG